MLVVHQQAHEVYVPPCLFPWLEGQDPSQAGLGRITHRCWGGPGARRLGIRPGFRLKPLLRPWLPTRFYHIPCIGVSGPFVTMWPLDGPRRTELWWSGVLVYSIILKYHPNLTARGGPLLTP